MCFGRTSCGVLPLHQDDKACVPLGSSADVSPHFQWSGSFLPVSKSMIITEVYVAATFTIK